MGMRFGSVPGLPTPTGTPVSGDVAEVSTASPLTLDWTPLPAIPAPMVLQATTGAAGFALQNATPNILTWTAPNDGQPHRFMIVGNENVSSAETGGQVNVTFTRADNSGSNSTPIFGGSAGAGYHAVGNNFGMVAPGSTVTIAQNTVLSAGAATIWAEIWGS